MEHVNHPSHYNVKGRKECIIEMLEKYGFVATANFALLSAYKYLYRAGEKDDNPTERDWNKAHWYFTWVENKAHELGEKQVFEWDLFWDISRLLAETKSIPWVEVK